MDNLAALGTLAGLGLTAGFRLYATVLALGLGLRLGLLHLKPGLEHLSALGNDWVLGIAGLAYAAEFFADKIPWFDSLWDSFHTFIRPLGAALLGATAFGDLSPAAALGAGLFTGTIALTGHSAKAGTRLVVNHSPEPFTNVGLSFVEDFLAIGGTWLAVQHPGVMIGIVAVFLVLFAWLAPRLFRMLRSLFAALSAFLTRPAANPAALRAVAASGVPGMRGSLGTLKLAGSEVAFTAKRWGMRREYHSGPVKEARYERGFFMDRLILEAGGKPRRFDVLKTRGPGLADAVGVLQNR